MRKIGADIHNAIADMGGDADRVRLTMRAQQVRNRYREAIQKVYRDQTQLFLEHTNNVYIMDKGGVRTLIVYVDDSIFAAELNAQRELIKLELLELFGEDVQEFEIHISRGAYKENHPFAEDARPPGAGARAGVGAGAVTVAVTAYATGTGSASGAGRSPEAVAGAIAGAGAEGVDGAGCSPEAVAVAVAGAVAGAGTVAGAADATGTGTGAGALDEADETYIGNTSSLIEDHALRDALQRAMTADMKWKRTSETRANSN